MKMSKKEMIEHWMEIIKAVFTVENVVMPAWQKRLEEAKGQPQEIIDKVCDEYVRAIATELINKGYTFDEED